MERVRYMISDASNLIQVESHVLRYWEEELELDVPRNEMGHRYYTEENIRQFKQIKRLKAEGFQLKAIKMLIHNPPVEEDEPVGISGKQDGQSVLAENREGRGGQNVLAENREGRGGQSVLAENREGRGGQSVLAENREGQGGQSLSAENYGRQVEQGLSAGNREGQAGETASAVTGFGDRDNTQISAVGAEQISRSQGEHLSQLEQFQLMMNDIVCAAIARNNQALGQEIGNQVEEKVIKEMNYLMRDREEREEERFRRLDEAIRKRQRRTVKENKKRKFLHTPIHKAEEIG